MHVVLIGLLLNVLIVGSQEFDALLITNSNYKFFIELSKKHSDYWFVPRTLKLEIRKECVDMMMRLPALFRISEFSVLRSIIKFILSDAHMKWVNINCSNNCDAFLSFPEVKHNESSPITSRQCILDGWFISWLCELYRLLLVKSGQP
jgi:hypothetical protein